MEPPQKPKSIRISTILIITCVMASLFAGGLLGYSIGYLSISAEIDSLYDQLTRLQNDLLHLSNVTEIISSLQSQLISTQEQLANLQVTENIIYQNVSQEATYQNITYVLTENVSLPQIYEQVKESVVVVRGVVEQYDIFGRLYYAQVQGSGFTYNFTGELVVITNYHVIHDAINVTVTFTNGNAYAAALQGADPYADLAVLSTNSPQSEYKPLAIGNSSTLKVGDPVIAVGTPYGLAGSMTTGMVSALGRTITEELTSGYPIANVIQTTTPLNPGNSGGPLLNYQGQVIGITTAIVSESQGLGFAIPSNTILREIESLVAEGSYNQHPWLGVSGTDMNYYIAESLDIDFTYGYLIAETANGGPADQAGLQGGTQQTIIAGEWVTIGGDIIIAINDAEIMNIDDLSSYLEEYTLPGQTIRTTILRNGQTMILTVELGTRPPLSLP